jgi:heme exporter protein B
MNWFRVAALLFMKDFREEVRRKESAASSLLFALLSLVLFAFALDPTRINLNTSGSGLLWLIILFAGSIFMGASFRKETENGTIYALLLSPCDRSAIYAAKFLVNLVFILLLEVFVLLLAAFFLDFRPGPGLPALVVVWIAVSVGYSAVGTLFSALMSRLRGGEIIYPILLFPILIPLFIGAATLTQSVLMPDFSWSDHWLRLILLYDILFLAACTALFEYAVEE